MENLFKSKKAEILFVIAITLIGLTLRLVAINNFGDLWVDELYSYYFACQKSVQEILKTLATEDFHVPLYFISLHYWMKIFSNSDFAIRLMGGLLSTLIIPLSYFILKDLFKSKFTASAACIFLCLSAFNIHYSAEVRFYGTSMTLALLNTYFFVKFIENSACKFKILYTIFSLILLYTYNFAFAYIFWQFVVGIIFLITQKRFKDLKSFFLIYLIIAMIYAPVVFVILHHAIIYKNTLINFARDIFGFDLVFFYNFLTTTYANVFTQYQNNDIMQDLELLKHFFTKSNVFLALIPAILGLIGLINAFKERSQTFILFTIPAIALLIFQIILALSGNLALILRYTIVSNIVLLCASMYGWSLFKNKKLIKGILIVWGIINISALFCTQNSALNRRIVYSGFLPAALNGAVGDFKLKDSDYVFIPRFSKLIKKYVNTGKIADFDTYDALLLGNRPQDLEFIFSKDFANKLTRKNLKTNLYEYITTNASSTALEENLNQEYFSKMKPGERFVVITDENSYLKAMEEIQNFIRPVKVFAASAIYYPLSAKIVLNIITTAQKNLKPVIKIEVNEFFVIYVFEK